MHKTDLAIGVGLFAFGALMVFVLIPLTTYDGMHFGLPPTFFPTLLSACVMFFSACLVAQSIIRLVRRGGDREASISLFNLLVLAIAMAIVVGGALLIDFVGLFVGAPLMIVALMLLLGERNLLLILLTATVPVVAVHLLARHVLMMPLP